MSSNRGPWDDGPPGAEQDNAPQRAVCAAYEPAPHAAPPLHAMPATDPWTGVSYSHYGPQSSYDYGAYNASNYIYNYDPSYYQNSLSHSSSYAYSAKPHSKSGSPKTFKKHHDNKKSDSSSSRSVSPYKKKEKAYSWKRDSSYEGSSPRKSRSRSRSLKKHSKYSLSSRSSSQSRSSSHSVVAKKKHRRSVSSGSDRSYKGKTMRKCRSHSFTPPLKGSPYSRSDTKRTPSQDSSYSNSPKYKDKKKLKGKDKRNKDKRQRDDSTPPRIRKKRSLTPTKSKKGVRSLITPPKKDYKSDNSATPPKSHRYKGRDRETALRTRDTSLTPPRSYAVKNALSSSRSRSRTRTPKHSKNRSNTPKSQHSRSQSASSKSSSTLRHSKSRSHKNQHKARSNERSSTEDHSKSRSVSRSRSKSPQKSKGRPKSSKNKPQAHLNSSRSSSKTPSDEERRGQFTVSDRKKYWRKHRSLQEKKGMEKQETDKTPPKEVKPPPGAVLPDEVFDINYGDPPEVEGPNFEEILPPADTLISTMPSSSKSKSIPIPIKNDGSFLEMFKKMQEGTKKVEEGTKPEIKKPILPFIGKRRGGRVLKTGIVKKAKAIDEQPADNNPKDAWSLYMQEVKKYRETSCEEERKTRPLVK